VQTEVKREKKGEKEEKGEEDIYKKIGLWAMSKTSKKKLTS